MTATLKLTLPDDVEAEIAAAVEAGEYASAEDAVSNAIAEWRVTRRLDTAQGRDELGRLWLNGIESGRGKGLSIEELKREASRRSAGN